MISMLWGIQIGKGVLTDMFGSSHRQTERERERLEREGVRKREGEREDKARIVPRCGRCFGSSQDIELNGYRQREGESDWRERKRARREREGEGESEGQRGKGQKGEEEMARESEGAREREGGIIAPAL